MRLRWSRTASDDIGRLHVFLLPLDAGAAAPVVEALLSAPENLLDHPRLGEQIETCIDREVRRLHVRDYELRYEIEGDTIIILRVWHEREER